jgi:HlyD family secretion protein
MKKLVWILILLGVVGGGGYYYYSSSNTTEPPQVVKATVTQGDVTEFVQATGTLEAIRTVQVGPQVSGTILWLGADFNSIVKQGQVIARLDPSLLQTQVDIQTANIERQETDIELQRVQLQDAERTLVRTRELFEKGLANQTQLEQAELAIKQRQAQIASAEKSLVQARASLSQAQLNVSYTEVKSSIDGVVVNRRVDIGQSVQSSMNITPFFDIATDLTSLRLTAGVDEAEIGKIRPGMEVTFQVDTYQGQNFRGRVENVRLNATTQNNVVTYPVWISVPNPDLRLRPSLTANLRIIVNTVSDVVRIPNQALRFRPTPDMYTALGLTPPEQPAGGRGARLAEAGGPGANGAPGAPAAAGREGRGQQPAAAAAPSAAPQPPSAQASAGGRQGRDGGAGAPQGVAGQGRNGGGRGNFANLSPEERQRLMAAGGRNGGFPGRGGRGGGAAQPAAVRMPDVPDQKIDALFAPLQVRPQPGTVWTWDEATKTLKDIRVTTGVFDNQFSQLLSGDVAVGAELVTNIVLPVTAAQRAAQQQSIFGGQQGRGGFGGPQPGGPGGGGGNRGGGGGGGRGGF